MDLLEINWKTIQSPEFSCKVADDDSGQPNKYCAQLSLLDISGGCARSTAQVSTSCSGKVTRALHDEEDEGPGRPTQAYRRRVAFVNIMHKLFDK